MIIGYYVISSKFKQNFILEIFDAIKCDFLKIIEN